MNQEPNGTVRTNASISPRSGEIQQAIGQTKSAISEDIKAIGDKLDPDALKASAREVVQDAKAGAKEVLHDARQEASGMIREAKDVAVGSLREAKDQAFESVSSTVNELGHSIRTAGRSTSNFVTTNAVPLSLIGLGVGWLWMAHRDAGASRDAYHGPTLSGRRYDGSYVGQHSVLEEARRQGAELTHEVSQRASELASGARERLGDLRERATHQVGDLRERAAHQVESVRHTAAETGSQLTRRAAELGREARSQFAHAEDATRRYADQNPLALGALALAAGVGVAFLLPSSKQEDRLLGQTRDRLVGDARRAAADVSRVARDAAEELRGGFSD